MHHVHVYQEGKFEQDAIARSRNQCSSVKAELTWWHENRPRTSRRVGPVQRRAYQRSSYIKQHNKSVLQMPVFRNSWKCLGNGETEELYVTM